MGARKELDGPPVDYVSAVEQVRGAVLRPEISCEEMPAPQRIAPHAFAMTGDVTVAGEDIGTGRIVLLHDPAGNDAWDGTFRLVTFARAEVDAEMASDPLLADVGWSWLTEALAAHGAAYLAPSGSVTVVRSEGFGSMKNDGSSAQVEIRASWTPVVSAPGMPPGTVTGVGDHVGAWGDLLCTVAGLPPLAPGVVPLPQRRARPDRHPRR